MDKLIPTPTSVGMTTVHRKSDGHPVTIDIQRVPDKFDKIIWLAVAPDDPDHRYGYITFYHEKGNSYVENPYRKLGPFIHVDGLSGNQECSGVGTSLMMAAMEYGNKRDCNFRIKLIAAGNSPPFYWNLGMRTTGLCSGKAERVIAKLQANKQKRTDEDLGSPIMALPRDGAPEWRQRIFQDPILFETRDLVSLLKKYLSEAAFLAFSYHA